MDPGCCSANWGLLLPQVAALVALDQAANPGTAWVYYGLINGGIPVNVPGCNGWGATGGLAGSPVTYAHEIGHQFGLPHARCGNAGAGNAAYPVYEPYDLPVDPPGTSNWTMASIGEYGLDINNGDIANPIDFEDFMSYCGPRWMSAFTYAYLTNIAGLTPVVIPTGSGAAARVITDEERNFERDETAIVPLIHILGSIDVDGKVEVVSVARLKTRYLRGFGRETGHMAQLLDADGRIIAQDHLYSYPSEGCESRPGEESGCSECKEKQPILFKAMVNDVAPGSVLRIVKRGKVVWERKGTEKPPGFGEVTAELNKEGALKLTWRFERDSKENAEHAEVWVRWTNDDGRTWHALTVGQRGTSVTIDPAQLPSGYIRFQLLATDGFHTVTAVTEPVNLPAKPPAVTIQYPHASSRVYEERQIHLFGTVSSYTGNAIDPEKASWYIDGELVSNGFDAWVENPGRGRHVVRLDVQEGDMKGSASQEIEIIATNEEPSTQGH